MTPEVPMEMPEVEKLVAAARAGDREARGSLAERFGDRLRIWIQYRLGRRLGRLVNAEDLLQETFIQAFRAIGRLEWRGEARFLVWLKTIAEHAIQDEVKRLKSKKRNPDREVRLREGAADFSIAPGALAALLGRRAATASKALRREERFERLERALRTLSPEDQQVILLASVRGRPIREVAEQMGRSPDAVSMLHLRALRKLRAAFGTIDSTESFSLPHDRSLDRPEEGDEPR